MGRLCHYDLTQCYLILRCDAYIKLTASKTPETDMTEWWTLRVEKRVVKGKATTHNQLEGLTKDSFSGNPDWHPVLSLGISGS